MAGWKCYLIGFGIVSTHLSMMAVHLTAQSDYEEKLYHPEIESDEAEILNEALARLRANPIDLNRATHEQLQMIPGLPANLPYAILNHRKTNRRYAAVEDLRKVDGMSQELFVYLRQFVVVDTDRRNKKVRPKVEIRSRWLQRLDLPRGFHDGHFIHSPAHIYNRIRLQLSGKVQAGVLTEKDAGEQKFNDLQLQYVSIDLPANLSVLLGNYMLENGLGLVLASPFGTHKSTVVGAPFNRRSRRVYPFLSSAENAAYNGIAIDYRQQNINATGFLSSHRIDATPVSQTAVSALSSSGLHRTESEFALKDQQLESAGGFIVRMRLSSNLWLGAAGYNSKYQKSLSSPDTIRKHFSFRGHVNRVGGFNLNWRSRKLSFTGELAASKNLATAVIVSAIFHTPATEIVSCFRYYSPSFHNQHGSGFSEYGAGQNETGLYLAARSRFAGFTVSGYYDIFRRLWRSYRLPFPDHGHELLLSVEYKLSTGWYLKSRYTVRQKEELWSLNETTKSVLSTRQRRVRLQFDARWRRWLLSQSRFEANIFNYPGYSPILIFENNRAESGWLIFNNVRFKLHNCSIDLRCSYFDTGSYRTRIYQFESNVPGAFSNQILYGKGIRSYALIKLFIKKSMRISFKYSLTKHFNPDSIREGPEHSDKLFDRRIALQADFHLN